MNETSVTLRHYTPEDFDWLVELHRTHYHEVEGFDDSFAPLVASILEAFHSECDLTCERGWVAEREGARLGSVFCVRLNATTAKLRLFLLTSEARGQGIGKQMLDACMAFARAAGYARMQLWTHESHAVACALYAKSGWVCTASKPVHSFGRDLVEQAWEVTL